jgi:beta-1,4-N-acetylglucosaminyltransferase
MPPSPSTELFTVAAASLCLAITLVIAARIACTLPILQNLRRDSHTKQQRPQSTKASQPKLPNPKPIKLLVVLGSGGHTTEILKLYNQLSGGQSNYSEIHWIYAETDSASLIKVKQTLVQQDQISSSSSTTTHVYHPLPRPRAVHQSYLSSIPSTLTSFYHATKIYLKTRPHVILCNGPSTALPFVFISFIHKVLLPSSLLPSSASAHSIFVESYARVDSLSLTGKLVYPFVDRFLVHWPELVEDKGWRYAEYRGRLI